MSFFKRLWEALRKMLGMSSQPQQLGLGQMSRDERQQPVESQSSPSANTGPSMPLPTPKPAPPTPAVAPPDRKSVV